MSSFKFCVWKISTGTDFLHKDSGFPISVSFHQSSILIFNLQKKKEDAGEVLEAFELIKVFRISGNVGHKSIFFYFTCLGLRWVYSKYFWGGSHSSANWTCCCKSGPSKDMQIFFVNFSPMFLRFGNWKYQEFMCHCWACHCGFWSLLVDGLIWDVTTNCNFSATSLQKREARKTL